MANNSDKKIEKKLLVFSFFTIFEKINVCNLKYSQIRFINIFLDKIG